MKKYLSHVIYLLIIVFFAVFAQIKAVEAEKQRIIAEQTLEFAKRNEQMAEAAAARAIEQESKAVMAIKEAQMQAEKIQEVLKRCKSSKD